MYKKSEQTIKSRVDGLEVSVLAILPDANEKGDCKGIVQLIHGMCEYKERYLPLMEFLAEHGYASVIHDHRGHGKSVKSSRDLGYMYEVGVDGFLDDVLLINEFVHEQMPGVPVTVFGHSMGSLAARVFLREYDDCMDALILSGPPSKNGAVDMGILLAKMLKRLKGARSLGKILEVLSFGSYAAPFREEKSKYAWINSDWDAVKAYEADPLCGYTFTTDGYLVLLHLLKMTYQIDGWECKKPELPILFLGGEQDPCVGGKKKFEEEVRALKQVGYQNVSGKMYPGMRHEICNEPQKNLVFQDVLGFLE